MEGPLATVKSIRRPLKALAASLLAAASLAPATVLAGHDASPEALCALVEGMRERSDGRYAGSAPGFSSTVEGSVPVGTVVGYEIGPGLSLNGVGVYDAEDDFASVGPAFRVDIDDGVEITAGVQLQVADDGPVSGPGLYYAGLRLLF